MARIACIAAWIALGAAIAAAMTPPATTAPPTPGPWGNLQIHATDINIAEGVTADCNEGLNVTAQKGFKNCSNSEGWYGEIVDASRGYLAVVNPINGNDVQCFVGQIPTNSIKPFGYWGGFTFIRTSQYRGRATHEYRLIAGRYYAPFFVDAEANHPVLFGQGIYGNIHQLVNAFQPDSVAGDDPRFTFPPACEFAIRQLETGGAELARHEISRLVNPALNPRGLHATALLAATEKNANEGSSHEQLVARYHASFMPSFNEWPELSAMLFAGTLPESADNRPFATSVRNQGRCGGCWAFSTTALTELVWYKARGTPSNRTATEWLSPQSKIDCVHGDMNGTALFPTKGCQGGWPLAALADTVANGIATEMSYPYSYVSGARCKTVTDPGAVVLVKPLASAFMLPRQNVSLMMAAIATYGAVVGVINPPMTWAFYPGTGIFDDPACVPGLEHAILIVGYGTDEASRKPYWIVKNSFGAAWSDAGYIRMVRGVNMCGIEDFAFGGRPVADPPVPPQQQ